MPVVVFAKPLIKAFVTGKVTAISRITGKTNQPQRVFFDKVANNSG